jgi:hypothetical protein
MELLNEYDAKCAILGNRELLRTIEFISYSSKNNKAFYDGAEGLSKDLLDCIERGVKMIAIPLNFLTKEEAHSNMLIYRPDEKTIERFEPHGQKFYGYEKDQDEIINKTLKTMFEKKMKPYLKKYTPKYIPANEVCPVEKGFQYLEPQIKGLEQEGGGFCNLWSLFFLELIFLNPNISTKEVLQKALDISREDPQYLKNVIRGYVKKTEKTIDKFMKRIKETDGFNYKDYRTSKKSIYLEKKTNIADELLKYYLSIGSKNTQLDLYDEYKKTNRKGKTFYEEIDELKKKYSNIYNYIALKSIDDLNNVMKKLFGIKPMYKKGNEELAIHYILRMVEYKPEIEKKIYKLI